VADLPFPAGGALSRRLEAYVDVEGKLPRTLEALGPIAGREVMVLEADGPWRVRQLVAAGGRVVAVAPRSRVASLRELLADEVASGALTIAAGSAVATGRPAASADVVVSFWSAFRGGSDAEVREAERVLRPGGRLLVVHEYARDDLSRLWPAERAGELMAWSRRDGWFLRHGFKMRVIHAFWTFPDMATLRGVAAEVSDADAAALLADVRRPRLSWKLVVYHRGRVEESAADA
jgi:hypothetical protein